MPAMCPCLHTTLSYGTADPALIHYIQPGDDQIQQALHVSDPGRKKRKPSKAAKIGTRKGGSALDIALSPASTFPAPVVVPGDELFHDPDHPPQSVQDWVQEEDRNRVTHTRRTIYVIAPPVISDEVIHVDRWPTPEAMATSKPLKNVTPSRNPHPAPQPRAENIVRYLAAFYHGMQVMLLKTPQLEFVAWKACKARNASRHKGGTSKNTILIGLSTGHETVRIRCRQSKDSLFSTQLNLNDLLDTAISIVPADAYALLMLVHHDLYEDDDDIFCCGRAYGGSRVAVVSTARYRPELDGMQNVDLEHVWPASHCQQYLERLLGASASQAKKPRSRRNTMALDQPESAIYAAVIVSNAMPPPSTPSELSTLWLGRICKTASHELGHCFGIDHCTYYACVMQGTANLAEDSRQPPYLCPVDLAKLVRGTGCDEQERYRALLEFCEHWKEDRMFAGFGVWIRSHLPCRKESRSSP